MASRPKPAPEFVWGTPTIDPIATLSDPSLQRVTDARWSQGNQVRLLKDGPQTFAAWLDAIGRATRSVDLENYILQDDATGLRFADALIAAKARGVDCRVLYDWLGCPSVRPETLFREGGTALIVLGIAIILVPHGFAGLLALVTIWAGIDLLLRALRLWHDGAAAKARHNANDHEA